MFGQKDIGASSCNETDSANSRESDGGGRGEHVLQGAHGGWEEGGRWEESLRSLVSHVTPIAKVVRCLIVISSRGASNMVSYSILHKAYVKIFLHAAKHPHKQVNGVLLGKLVSDVVIIQDVVPLLHHWTSLSPMMEIGLDLVCALLDCLVFRYTFYRQKGTLNLSIYPSLDITRLARE